MSDKKIVLKGIPLNQQHKAIDCVHSYIGKWATTKELGSYYGVYYGGDFNVYVYQTKTSIIAMKGG